MVYYYDENYTYQECDEWIENIEDCSSSDLDVLQIFIDNSPNMLWDHILQLRQND